MSVHQTQDLQDVIFFQIVDTIKSNNLHFLDELTKKIGDCSNKINYYSNVLRKSLSNQFGIHNLNDEVGKLCAFLFSEGLYYSSYFIYCFASHDHYVNGFSSGFLKHFIYDYWCFSKKEKKFIPINERNIEMLRVLVSYLNPKEIKKITENMYHILNHLSKDHFIVILNQLKKYPDFSIGDITSDFLIELVSRNDGLIHIIIYEILNDNKNQFELSSFEIGIIKINYLIVQALKKLYILYYQISDFDYLKCKDVTETVKKIMHITLNIFKIFGDSEILYIEYIYNSCENITHWEEVINPLKRRIDELNINQSKMDISTTFKTLNSNYIDQVLDDIKNLEINSNNEEEDEMKY